MKKDFIDLENKYSKYLYKCYFECNKGWYYILEKFFEKFEKLDKIINLPKDFKIVQIKEKFGSLLIYTNFFHEEVDKIIKEAEKESQTVCEFCGIKNEFVKNVSRNAWFKTVCDGECEGSRNFLNRG